MAGSTSVKNWIIAALVAFVAVGGAVGAFAGAHTVNRAFEVRVWESVDDPSEHYLSIRSAGGSWETAGTIPVPLTDGASANGRYRYGDLRVVLPVPVDGDAPGGTAPGTAMSSGHWSITTYHDPIYDRETAAALLDGEAVIEKLWGGSELDDPYVQIYCDGADLYALVYWDDPIFAPVEQSPVPTMRSVPAVWRLDRNAPVEERWLPSTRGQATFMQYPARFIAGILGGETLIMRVTPASGEDHTLTVNVAGLADVIGNLRCYSP